MKRFFLFLVPFLTSLSLINCMHSANYQDTYAVMHGVELLLLTQDDNEENKKTNSDVFEGILDNSIQFEAPYKK